MSKNSVFGMGLALLLLGVNCYSPAIGASANKNGTKAASSTKAKANNGAKHKITPLKDANDAKNAKDQSAEEKPQQQNEISVESLMHTTKEIEVNSINFIKLKKKAKEIFIPNPDILDVQLLSDNSLYLIGLAPGTTTLVINDKAGNALVDCKVRVTFPIKAIKEAIADMHPDAKVDIVSLDKTVVLRGKVPSPEVASDIQEIASKLISDGEIVNKLTIETATQVMLKIKIAEVSRSVTKSLGINWRTVSNPKNGSGGIAYGMAFGNTSGFIEPTINDNGYETGAKLMGDDGLLTVEKGGRWLIHGNGQNPITALIDALAAESFASVLAEPTLVALSGTTATFKSGGELGYLVKQDGSDSYTTEFKDWGTEVEFTPIVLSEDRINITVKPKVSTVALGTSGQPEVASKEASATVELGSGQSLAIAGLLQTTASSSSTETPLLSDLPLIGTLFRNSSVEKSQKELVIIVTPYIVKPSSKELKMPTDMTPRMYSPLESILARRFHARYKHKGHQNAGFSIK